MSVPFIPPAHQEADYAFGFAQAQREARASGYHVPYRNLFSDEPEWHGYEDGFRAALSEQEVSRG